MGNTPSAKRWHVLCRALPTSYVIFITCGKRPSRSPMLTGMPRKSGSKHVRGVRPIERALEGRTDEEAEAVRLGTAGSKSIRQGRFFLFPMHVSCRLMNSSVSCPFAQHPSLEKGLRHSKG